MDLAPLPMDAELPRLVEAFQRDKALVLVAEPGAGKTTRVPRALLLEGFADAGEILVLQPRRMAARFAAARVAQELGEPLGERIGYQVRFEEKSSSRTRVKFITEGILTRRLSRDPGLQGVAAVVLDEFHERSLHADFALQALARLRRTQRPEFGLIVMSATLDAEPVASFLACTTMQVPGRTFPIAVRYRASQASVPLEKQVARAVAELVDEGEPGDILVFLPGAVEIRRAFEACQGLCARAGREVAVLHGDLTSAEQDRAVAVGARPKLILSTNIAETSLTLPQVTAVIDSGFARVAAHSPFSGLPTLKTQPISKASATQRAGRAGRVGPGRCIRLYSEHDFAARPAHDTPELLRADLSELRLSLAALGQGLSPADWLQPPPRAAFDIATRLLLDLNAIQDGDELLTELGQRMLELPVHPRLSRLLLECEARSIGRVGALAAALLSDRDVLLSSRARFGQGAQADAWVGPSDLLSRIEFVERLQAERFDASLARNEQLDLGVARRASQVQKRLMHKLRNVGRGLENEEDEQALGMAVLCAFPDRVAKRRRAAGAEVVFSRGGSAALSEQSEVREAEFMVVIEASSQVGRGVQARMASAIEPEWLLELFPQRIEDSTEVRFDPQRGRADAHHVLRYEGLVLDESRAQATSQQLADALYSAASDAGLGTVFDMQPVETFVARARYVASRARMDPIADDLPQELARLACAGAQSFEDLKRRTLTDYLSAVLPADVFSTLEREAPTHVQLPSGRRLQVHYEAGQPPYVASRLQDFFGMAVGPAVAGEPLVLHLLAPNQRPVQVTGDLSGFWQRHYPTLRKTLMRRYPKHAFPEDPLTATPPPPRPPRNAGRRTR